MQGGGEDTDERVMTSHTEICEGCEVSSVEEGHDVERVIARSESGKRRSCTPTPKPPGFHTTARPNLHI